MAAAVLNSPANGRESSPRTPEINFRQLDEAFLQTQARIWLGAILDKRFDESINISNLLADGQILYELYQVIQKCLEDRNGSSTKAPEREMVSPRDITEKYPYPRVECFLRLCQTLGLEDIDLFTSSDVVHKRNTRGVCLCLRILSKKARLKKLNVPDFDFVTYKTNSPVSMPTDMVNNRRRNIERSTSPACSSGQDTSRDSRGKQYWQGDLLVSSPETSNCKSDASHDGGGDEEVNSEVVESAVRTPTRFMSDDDASSPINSASSAAAATFDDLLDKVGSGELNTSHYSPEEHVDVEDRSSVGSPLHPSLDNDNDLDSTPVVASVGDNFVHIMDNGQTTNDDNASNRTPPVHLSWQDDSAEVEESNIVNEQSSSMFNECGENEIAQSCLLEDNKGNNENDDDAAAFSVNSKEHNAEEAQNSVAVETNGEVDNHGPCEDVNDDDVDQSNTDGKFVQETEKMDPNDQSVETCSREAGQGSIDDVQYVKNPDDQEQDDEPKPVSITRRNRMKSLVAKGTGTAAVIGLVLLFVQLRNKGKGKKEGQNSSNTETNNTNRINANAENHSSRVRERSQQANRVYPSDRLQLR